MTSRSLLKKIAAFLAVILLITVGGSFAFWEGENAKNSKKIFFQAVIYDGYLDDIFENIPSFVPSFISDKLQEIRPHVDTQTFNDMVKKVIEIYYNDINAGLHLALDASGLFDSNINQYDFLIYTVGQGEDMQLVIVYISAANNIPQNAVQLENALSQSWTGVNLISVYWHRGTLYNSNHAPVEYQGIYYFNQNDGDRYVSPYDSSTGTWFMVTPDLEYTNFNNVYPAGYVVKSGDRYYIANNAVWNTAPSPSLSWAWTEIYFYSGGVTAAGRVVMTDDNGGLRFWRALKSTSKAPSEITASEGDWQEFKNGWIGRRGDMTNKSYYFSHNTYNDGDIVIYGVTANLKYRYFAAKGAVPSNQPPMLEGVDGTLIVNDQYWEAWA